MGQQTVTVGGTNHRKHLVLTILTAGIWSPVWFLAWAFNGFR